jgi:hypothetical protein
MGDTREAVRGQRAVDDLVVVDRQSLVARRIEEDVHLDRAACQPPPFAGRLW